MKIYTKTGDNGTTSLFDGTRVSKDHLRVDLYGETDELNAVIGLAASLTENQQLKQELHTIQKDLFALGAKLANPADKKQKDKAQFSVTKITRLEKHIDKMESHLQPMQSFILPGGSQIAATLHVARTVCRRVERKMIQFHHKEPLNTVYLKFVNRLSDYLFVMARYANFLEGKKDIPW